MISLGVALGPGLGAAIGAAIGAALEQRHKGETRPLTSYERDNMPLLVIRRL
jgi:hypothetical protein